MHFKTAVQEQSKFWRLYAVLWGKTLHVLPTLHRKKI